MPAAASSLPTSATAPRKRRALVPRVVRSASRHSPDCVQVVQLAERMVRRLRSASPDGTFWCAHVRLAGGKGSWDRGKAAGFCSPTLAVELISSHTPQRAQAGHILHGYYHFRTSATLQEWAVPLQGSAGFVATDNEADM